MSASDTRTQWHNDAMQVAAVVLGEERTALTGWQRGDAIAAMSALGYSCHHIAWALNSTWQAVYAYSRRHGIPAHRHDQHIDWIAVDMVVTGAARIRLTGPDRIAAIRAMAPRLTDVEIAHRLMLDQTQDLIDIARRAGIALRRPERWSWQAYTSTGNGVTTGRRRRVVTA